MDVDHRIARKRLPPKLRILALVLGFTIGTAIYWANLDFFDGLWDWLR